MRTTIGFDFGTHQTKICVELREAGYLEYQFMTFKDEEGKESYFLPSMIQIGADGKLKYGFIEKQPCRSPKPEFVFDKPEPKWEDSYPEPAPPKFPSKPVPNMITSLFGQALYKSQMTKWEKECKKIKSQYDNEIKEWQESKKEAWDEYVKLHSAWEDEKNDTYSSYIEKSKEWKSQNLSCPQATYRYFKQAAFSYKEWEGKISPLYLSIWYIANIVFDIVNKYGIRFGLNIGVPTGREDGTKRRDLAVTMILSAYHLVDNVFHGNKEKFLDSTYTELLQITELIPCTNNAKRNAAILVFPEAVACLRPLLQGQKVNEGKMHIMMDIGGGTTDISFFTVLKNRPQIYNYQSIPCGLNYLTKIDDTIEVDGSGPLPKKLDGVRLIEYCNRIQQCLANLKNKLHKSFEKTGYEPGVLNDALNNRPIIYTGGGSTFAKLRERYFPYSVIHVDSSYWRKDCINQHDVFSLCPLLSTAYGLAIYSENDEVVLSDIATIFAHIKKEKPEHDEHGQKRSYRDDWRYKEYGVLNLKH